MKECWKIDVNISKSERLSKLQGEVVNASDKLRIDR